MKKLETNQFSDEDFPLNQSIDTAVMDRRWASGASCSSESHVAMPKEAPRTGSTPKEHDSVSSTSVELVDVVFEWNSYKSL